MTQLYVLTGEEPWAQLWPKLEAALDSGLVGMVQYRRKQTAPRDQPDQAAELQVLCAQREVPLIVNDDVGLAAQLRCGVHLGQGDGDLVAARQQLGMDAIIGRTCHDSLALAQQAVADGASYVAFGAVYPSASKPAATRVPFEVLTAARAQLNVPLCAIGGITVDNAAPLLAVPVDHLAVIGGVLDGSLDQVVARLARWRRLLAPRCMA